MKMAIGEVLNTIYRALQNYDEQWRDVPGATRINNVSIEGDQNGAEIILTLDDGEERHDFIIREKDIHEITSTKGC